MVKTFAATPVHRNVGLGLLILAYPLAHFITQYIPNPFVPTATVALNMIFPVLAGYFYGPVSGALAGGLGTALAGFLGGDVFDGLAIFPHAVMGIMAGWAGGSQRSWLAALMLLVGHALNLLFYWRFGLFAFDNLPTLALGIVTETTIGIVAIVLLIVWLTKWLYQAPDTRW